MRDAALPESARVVAFGVPESARVVAMLARAFQADAEMVYAMPDAGERASVLPWLIGLNVRYVCRYGAAFATPAFTGAAMWLPPGATTFTPGRMARVGMFAAPLRLRWRTLRRLGRMGAFAAGLHERCAPQRHWYLAQIGVEPGSQRQGIAGQLLRAMLPRIDADGVPCYLETAKHANVGLYERFGFRVVAEATPREGPTLWAMVRDARRDEAADTGAGAEKARDERQP